MKIRVNDLTNICSAVLSNIEKYVPKNRATKNLNINLYWSLRRHGPDEELKVVVESFVDNLDFLKKVLDDDSEAIYPFYFEWLGSFLKLFLHAINHQNLPICENLSITARQLKHLLIIAMKSLKNEGLEEIDLEETYISLEDNEIFNIAVRPASILRNLADDWNKLKPILEDEMYVVKEHITPLSNIVQVVGRIIEEQTPILFREKA